MNAENEPMIRVRVVTEEHNQALVEEISTLKRVAVPLEKLEITLHGLALSQSAFEAGIAYGIAWEAHFPAELALELRRHGLHTAQDVLNNPRQAERALRAAYAPVLQTVYQLARKLGG